MEEIKLTDEEKVMKHKMEQMVNTYDSYMKRMSMGKENKLRKLTIGYAQVKSGDCVLEIGCATGNLTLEAKRQVGPKGKACGIDIIPGMIEVSKKKAALTNLEVDFQLGSIDKIPFPDNYFDVVMCSFMIFHISETRRNDGIADIYRVLKANGRLLILDTALPENAIPRAIVKLLFREIEKYDVRNLISIMKTIGFSDAGFYRSKLKLFGLPVIAYVLGSANKTYVSA